MNPWHVTFILEEGITLDSREGPVEATCEAKLLLSGSTSWLVLEHPEMTALAVEAEIQRGEHPREWRHDRTLVLGSPGIQRQRLDSEHAEYARVHFALRGGGRASVKGRVEPLSR